MLPFRVQGVVLHSFEGAGQLLWLPKPAFLRLRDPWVRSPMSPVARRLIQEGRRAGGGRERERETCVSTFGLVALGVLLQALGRDFLFLFQRV